MLFKKKPNLYFEFLDTRIRYIAMDPQNQSVIAKAEIPFETILMGANLDPLFADVSSLCLYRMIESNKAIELGENNHTLVFQWSPTHTTMMVFNQNLPKFVRNSRNPSFFDDWELTAEGDWLLKE